MKRRPVLISFTHLNAGGGVPRWNRDFIAGFPGAVHFSWDDMPKGPPGVTNEWDAAFALNTWLHMNKKVTADDIIIADGFWGERLSDLGYNVISVAHGIWSHLTIEDVKLGRQPEFPFHHAKQVEHRRKHLARGNPIVAVSDFISYQMKCQWDFDSITINNAIDLEKFKPATAQEWGSWHWDDDPAIIHGVTTANKGFDHIEAVKKAIPPPGQVMLLDEAEKDWQIPKYDCLKLAHLVVQPSAYEGNSYFVLETLASGTPIVAYDVGLLWSIKEIAKRNGVEPCIGAVIPRKYRSPQETAKVTKFICDSIVRDSSRGRNQYNPRQVAELFSLKRFHDEWRSYLEDYEYRLDLQPSPFRGT